jgi:uncharacterized protein (DUF1501 family)
MKLSRRNFLQASLSGLAYFTTCSTVPLWLGKSAKALSKALANGRILVIVQQAGGNDGLNTVIPYTDPLYTGNSLRPTLHITSGLEATTLDEQNALHPKLTRLKNWFTNGNVAVVNNVGYPNPNLSHFVATDYWELGTSPGSALSTTQGWIARYFDSQCGGLPPDQIDALTMLAAGKSEVPLTLRTSPNYLPPAVASFGSYALAAPSGDQGTNRLNAIEALNTVTTLSSSLDFVMRSSATAQASIDDIAAASQQPTINSFPVGSLGTGLDIASKVIRGGFPTNIFYVSQGGYDTHANQIANGDPINGGDHPALLDTFDQGIDAFLKDMEQAGLLDKVVLMTFSEFGRRVQENSSDGTDHGTSNCLFVAGGGTVGGIYGGQPNLADLQGGNLKHSIDFRSVYSRVLQDWLLVDPEPIFGTADFTDPVLDIQGGMTKAPIFGEEVVPPDPADVNVDGTVDAIDVQFVINGALGLNPPVDTDVNDDGGTDAVDVQTVINSALGLKSK